MIEPLYFPDRHSFFEPLPNPFMRGQGERPIRISFHTESLKNLCEREQSALDTLRELSNLEEIEALDTAPRVLPQIEIGPIDFGNDYIPVRVIADGQGRLFTGITPVRDLPDIAAYLVGNSAKGQDSVKAMLDELIVARAHASVEGDILVTASQSLLKNRTNLWVRDANPRSPLEAAQIVGLFLRSRDVYTYKVVSKGRRSFDRGFFYWVLARHKLPEMWRYFSACVYASKGHESDDLLELGESVLSRSVRALEARDAIGVQFYVQSHTSSKDQMMYHFDYLTLLLSGAIDAQARIAHRAYQIQSNEYSASFRRDEFRKALKRSQAQQLYDIVSEPHFKDTLDLIFELRNTIHGAALKNNDYQHDPRVKHQFIVVPRNIANKIYDAAQRLGSKERWGIFEDPSGFLRIEPYSYAVALVEEGLGAINAVARATDVTKLFPDIPQNPPLSQGPPINSVFDWGNRLALLG